MDLQNVGCGGMGWSELIKDRARWRVLLNAVMKFKGPYNAGNLTGCKPVGFSKTLLHGVSKPEGKNQLQDPDIDRRIILSWIFSKWDVGVWTGIGWLRIGTGGGHL
jgi:hypothetical protein